MSDEVESRFDRVRVRGARLPLDAGGGRRSRGRGDGDREPTAWGITLEPEAGSASPTGDILFTAEV